MLQISPFQPVPLALILCGGLLSLAPGTALEGTPLPSGPGPEREAGEVLLFDPGVTDDASPSLRGVLDARLASVGPVVARLDARELSLDWLKRRGAAQLAAVIAERPDLDDAMLRGEVVRILRSLIDNELLLRLCAASGIRPRSRAGQRELAELARRLGGQERLDVVLRWHGLKRRDVLIQAAEEHAIARWARTVVKPTVSIDRGEAERFYEEHGQLYQTPGRVRAAHILIAAGADVEGPARREARQKAERLVRELRSGADFGELARRHSGCATASRGGDLGTFGRGELPKPFESAAFDLAPGAVSDVVETAHGFHIVRVLEREGASPQLFEDVEERVRSQLIERKLRAAIDERLEQARAQATIEICVEQP